jgi:hypothetical protein
MKVPFLPHMVLSYVFLQYKRINTRRNQIVVILSIKPQRDFEFFTRAPTFLI